MTGIARLRSASTSALLLMMLLLLLLLLLLVMVIGAPGRARAWTEAATGVDT